MGLRAVGFAIAAIAVPAIAMAASPTAPAQPLAPAVRGRCVVVEIDPPPGPRATISHLLYLDRCAGGCVVTKGGDDARTDHSSIPDGNTGDTVTLSEWSHGDEVWDATVACVREVLLPYGITVTDQDPGSQSHHESMVAGDPTEFGLASDIAGISPMAGDCHPLDNMISFSFANAYGGDDPYEHCWTIVHEAGHSYGLEHVFECSDPMTYLTDCGRKFFRDRKLACARTTTEDPWVETDCRCSDLQNTHQKLLATFGAGAGAPPPTTTIPLPNQDDEVVSGFVVYTIAEDPRGLSHIKLYINGAKWLELEINGVDPGPHPLRTAANLPDGYLDIEVRAYNDLEQPGSAFVSVLKGAPCISPASCLDGQSCSDGRCAWPPPSVAFGDPCVRSPDCLSELCYERDGTRLCTAACDDQDDCASDFACGDDGICWPEGAGCCSVGGDRPWRSHAFLAILVAVLCRRRRR